MAQQPRHPAGSPIGGQFAVNIRSKPDGNLPTEIQPIQDAYTKLIESNGTYQIDSDNPDEQAAHRIYWSRRRMETTEPPLPDEPYMKGQSILIDPAIPQQIQLLHKKILNNTSSVLDYSYKQEVADETIMYVYELYSKGVFMNFAVAKRVGKRIESRAKLAQACHTPLAAWKGSRRGIDIIAMNILAESHHPDNNWTEAEVIAKIEAARTHKTGSPNWSAVFESFRNEPLSTDSYDRFGNKTNIEVAITPDFVSTLITSPAAPTPAAATIAGTVAATNKYALWRDNYPDLDIPPVKKGSVSRHEKQVIIHQVGAGADMIAGLKAVRAGQDTDRARAVTTIWPGLSRRQADDMIVMFEDTIEKVGAKGADILADSVIVAASDGRRHGQPKLSVMEARLPREVKDATKAAQHIGERYKEHAVRLGWLHAPM